MQIPSPYTFYPEAAEFYPALLAALEGASQKITLIYYAFDDGLWARAIAATLRRKAGAGVAVRLMVDDAGLVFETVSNGQANYRLLQELRSAGVQVHIFRPAAPGLTLKNRLHIKICAVDENTAFFGGSNISDHYPIWNDANVQVNAPVGDTFHQVYEMLCGYSAGGTAQFSPRFNLPGAGQVVFTLPGRSTSLRAALLHLIRSAQKAIYLRTWYFLPDAEILEALAAQARRGVQVHIMLSHQTRVRPIDWMNHFPCHTLTQAGCHIYRYAGRYMHAKAAWNDQGDILLGSANLDSQSMLASFEFGIALHDPRLHQELHRWFWQAVPQCRQAARSGTLAQHITPLLAPTLMRLAEWL